jgi:serine/threonine-protein kinase
VAGDPASDRVVLLDPEDPTPVVCRPAPAGCAEGSRLEGASTSLGQPVAAQDTIFVPDPGTGSVWVLDAAGRLVARAPVLARAARFDLVERQGVVFYNEPGGNHAGVIDPDGRVHPVLKYSLTRPAAGPTAPADTPPPTPSDTPSSKPPPPPARLHRTAASSPTAGATPAARAAPAAAPPPTVPASTGTAPTTTSSTTTPTGAPTTATSSTTTPTGTSTTTASSTTTPTGTSTTTPSSTTTPTTRTPSSTPTTTTATGTPSTTTPTGTPTTTTTTTARTSSSGSITGPAQVQSCAYFSGTSVLGDGKTLILAKKNLDNGDPQEYVEYAFGWQAPQNLSSWRGAQYFAGAEGQHLQIRLIAVDLTAAQAAAGSDAAANALAATGQSLGSVTVFVIPGTGPGGGVCGG